MQSNSRADISWKGSRTFSQEAQNNKNSIVKMLLFKISLIVQNEKKKWSVTIMGFVNS